MKKKLIHSVTSMILGLSLLQTAKADVYVIVNSNNPVQSMSQKDVLDLFMGRRKSFSSGRFAQTLDMPKESEDKAHFYKLLTDMDMSQINSYWARLIFSGQTLPPKVLDSEHAMLENIRKNVDAIGYVQSQPDDKNVRVVLVLSDAILPDAMFCTYHKQKFDTKSSIMWKLVRLTILP